MEHRDDEALSPRYTVGSSNHNQSHHVPPTPTARPRHAPAAPSLCGAGEEVKVGPTSYFATYYVHVLRTYRSCRNRQFLLRAGPATKCSIPTRTPEPLTPVFSKTAGKRERNHNPEDNTAIALVSLPPNKALLSPLFSHRVSRRGFVVPDCIAGQDVLEIWICSVCWIW